MSTAQKPIFNKRIFWDVVFESLDYDAKAGFVIERVFERGDVDDIRNCRRYYGVELVTQTLLKAKYLPETRHVHRFFERSNELANSTDNELDWYNGITEKALNWLTE